MSQYSNALKRIRILEDEKRKIRNERDEACNKLSSLQSLFPYKAKYDNSLNYSDTSLFQKVLDLIRSNERAIAESISYEKHSMRLWELLHCQNCNTEHPKPVPEKNINFPQL